MTAEPATEASNGEDHQNLKTMAAHTAKNFHFLSFLFKIKDLMMSNGLVILGTMGSEELFSVFAFHCPCAPAQNYKYGLVTTCIPNLVLFFISIILNNKTWKLVTKCKKCMVKKCLDVSDLTLTLSILCQALMTPVIWSVISLLRGKVYICTFSEFVDPSSLSAGDEEFPVPNATQILAKFPCGESPAHLSIFQEEVSRRLMYESQLLGWKLIGMVIIMVFITKCFKHCRSGLSFLQKTYRAHYLAYEDQLFQHTAEMHAQLLAANNVKSFFGFVALSKDDRKRLIKYLRKDKLCMLPKSKWNAINDNYPYCENQDPLHYSNLHKWAQGQKGRATAPDMEMP